MEKQRKDISPEETLTQPFIVGIPDFRSGVVGLIERHIMRGTIRDFLMQTGCPCRVLKLPLVDISAAPGGQEIFS